MVKGGYGARHGIVNLAARGMLRCVGGAAARVGGPLLALCCPALAERGRKRRPGSVKLTMPNKVLGVVSAEAKSAGVVCDPLHVEHEQVYQAIIEAAEARRCDLILMASHGRRGVSAVVLGSETVKVLTHSKIPVLVYR